MEAEQMSRPLTPFFVFLQELRKKGKIVNSKEASKQWGNLSKKERGAYDSEYRKKVEEYEKFLESQGFKPRRVSQPCDVKLTPIGKCAPSHIRAKRVRTVCGSSREVLPSTKQVYRGLGKVLEAFIEEVGKVIEDERRKEWEPIITCETVYKAITNIKMFDKINGKLGVQKLEMKEFNQVITELIKMEEKKKAEKDTDDDNSKADKESAKGKHKK
eukprot:TRINITY_DN1761_c0_g1_i12.p1 TRINITY_DN1761_c0_g1~~TRINITY_DN1761_c0_g1_i12.p1  ORF type:complete len:215 (-),score=74.50 TRINITY_DN1761_c0_g1_i12:153-797(-)